MLIIRSLGGLVLAGVAAAQTCSTVQRFSTAGTRECQVPANVNFVTFSVFAGGGGGGTGATKDVGGNGGTGTAKLDTDMQSLRSSSLTTGFCALVGASVGGLGGPGNPFGQGGQGQAGAPGCIELVFSTQ